MKVYLVHCEVFNDFEYTNTSMLLGIYSSMDSAIVARDKFVKDEFIARSKSNPHISIDDENNPVVTTFYRGEPEEENTFTIEEWTVQ